MESRYDTKQAFRKQNNVYVPIRCIERDPENSEDIERKYETSYVYKKFPIVKTRFRYVHTRIEGVSLWRTRLPR